MNLQASIAFLLSAVALISGQDDQCDDKIEAASRCLGEDAWATCEECFESALEGGQISINSDRDDEENCGPAMTNYGKAFGQCIKSGACDVTCKNDVAALIDCSMAMVCPSYSVNDYAAIS